MKRAIAVGFMVGGLLAGSAGVSAQTTPRGTAAASAVEKAVVLRVAVVDVHAVERSAAAAGTASLEEYRSTRMAGLQQRRDEIQAIVVKINEGGAALTADQRQALLDEMRAKQESLRAEEQKTRADLEAASTTTAEAIRTHIKKVADARGVHLVLERSADAVLFSAAAIDLTAAVIESLQAKPAKPVK